MKINFENMCQNEIRKAVLLLQHAVDKDIDLTGSCVLGVNQVSGNVYLWLEDVPAVLYIDLISDTVRYVLTCPKCGEEWDTEDLYDSYTLCDECTELEA